MNTSKEGRAVNTQVFHMQGEGYPDTSAFCSNMLLNKKFTLDLMFMKYEADLLCQNITYFNTKGREVRVSHLV